MSDLLAWYLEWDVLRFWQLSDASNNMKPQRVQECWISLRSSILVVHELFCATPHALILHLKLPCCCFSVLYICSFVMLFLFMLSVFILSFKTEIVAAIYGTIQWPCHRQMDKTQAYVQSKIWQHTRRLQKRTAQTHRNTTRCQTTSGCLATAPSQETVQHITPHETANCRFYTYTHKQDITYL